MFPRRSFRIALAARLMLTYGKRASKQPSCRVM